MLRYKRPFCARLTASLLLVAMAGAAVAGPLEDGVAAYHRGDYATAIPLLLQLAEHDNLDKAQYGLGLIYQNVLGVRGVMPDFAEAAKWYRKAADQGFAEAQNNLGVLYASGQGVPQDYVEAVRLFGLAAGQGSAKGQNNLGEAYKRGTGVSRDYAEAVRLFSLAARQGLAEAQNNLGEAYENGYGVLPNYAEAVKWYNVAAQQGLAQAQNNLGVVYEKDHQGVPQDIVQAYMWLTLSAEQGYDNAVKNREIIIAQMTAQQTAAAENSAREWKPTSTPIIPPLVTGAAESPNTDPEVPGGHTDLSAITWTGIPDSFTKSMIGGSAGLAIVPGASDEPATEDGPGPTLNPDYGNR
jgi:uncharacterized protein